jgi:hypothetical protein
MRLSHISPALLICTAACWASDAPAAPRYFGHEARADRHGVIAPWYTGLNGQCDLRARIAAETMKRYPWTAGKDGKQLPDYIYSGRWSISSDGAITPGELKDWGNGDLVQRGTYSIFGLVRYYQYSGDPAAIAHICMIADAMLDRCRTGPDHEWPDFIISVPNAGEPYGPCSPKGMIQLDLAALAGVGIVRAYQVTGDERYYQAARHWADVFAARRSRVPGEPPWNRYANPQDAFWNDRQTGGAVLVAWFLDEVIELEQTKEPLPDGSRTEVGRDARPPIAGLVEARNAAREYMRDVLLPRWHVDETWGRDYWDWEHPVQSESLSEMVPRYFMQHRDAFPNWIVDCRNILSLYHTRACVSPLSNGDVYHGAWAYPEGSQCCERSLSYPPMQIGAALAELSTRTGDAWAREMARRQLILATYDAHETGVVEDGLDGGQVVAGGWFQISHPLPLAYVLDAMGWLPDLLGANRENHIMRAGSVVQRIRYAPGKISYIAAGSSGAGWSAVGVDGDVDVLRLAFVPTRISTEQGELAPGNLSDPATQVGYSVRPLANGDCIVTIRRNGRIVVIQGEDPARRIEEDKLTYTGEWTTRRSRENKSNDFSGGTDRATDAKGATASLEFEGNQVRVIAATDTEGGLADVYLDGVKQLCGIDFWNPVPGLTRSVVWYRSGLTNGKHTLSIVARGEGNPLSRGKGINIDAVDCSAAEGDAGTGEGGGPTSAQRWIFGYTGREDYIDSKGKAWRPATEIVHRLGHVADAVAAWYVEPRRQAVAGTQDPILYRHGMRGQDFTAYATVGPGKYHVRLKFMESRWTDDPAKRSVDIFINGRQVVDDMDIAATAAGKSSVLRLVSPNSAKVYDGLNRAVDLVFDGIEPQHGVITVRFRNDHGGEAIVSAMEVGPGDGGPGAKPLSAPASQPVQ